MTPEHEKEIIERIKDGEYGLYRELVLMYQDRLFSFVLKLVMDEDDARDICQESFLKSYKHLSSFRFKSKFSTWLFQIAYNSAMTFLKKNSSTNDLLLKNEIISDGEDHTENIEKNELSDIINIVLNRIKDDYRIAIHLFYSENYNYREIAKIMKIPINTVSSHLRRGKEIIKQILLEEYQIEDYI